MKFKKNLMRKYIYNPILNLYETIAKKYLRKKSKIYLNKYPILAQYSFDFISNEISIKGRYEDAYLSWIEKNLSKFTLNKTTLDIGANIGNHAVAFSFISREVIAFEPNPKIFKLLDINKDINSNINIYNYGLSDKNEILNAYVPKHNIGGGTVNKKRVSNASSINYKFKLKKLDSLKFMQKKNIGLIKIDIEGNELKAFKGMINLLMNQSPIIVFEKNDLYLKNEDIKFLKKVGYQYFYEFIDNSSWIFKNKFLRIIESFIFGTPMLEKSIKLINFFDKKYDLILSSKFPIN